MIFIFKLDREVEFKLSTEDLSYQYFFAYKMLFQKAISIFMI